MKDSKYSHCQAHGFTLVELLVTVALMGVLAAIALPSFQSFLFTSRISSYTTSLHGALLYARSEAIKRGQPVTICRSENAETASPSCSTTNSVPVTNTGWGAGWIIFTDLNTNGIYEPGNAQPETLIRVQGKLIKTPTDGSIIPVPQRKYITFGATGQTFGTFVRLAINRPDADTNAAHDRFICIASGGRARVDTTLCTN